MCIVLLYLELPTVLVSSISFDSCNHFASFSADYLEPSGKVFDTYIPIRIECSKVSHSLHILQFCISVFVFNLLQQEASLMIAEDDIDARVLNVDTCHFIVMFP